MSKVKIDVQSTSYAPGPLVSSSIPRPYNGPATLHLSIKLNISFIQYFRKIQLLELRRTLEGLSFAPGRSREEAMKTRGSSGILPDSREEAKSIKEIAQAMDLRSHPYVGLG